MSRDNLPSSLPTPTTLPSSPLRFTLHFIGQFRWWYVAIVILEVGAATSGIMTPYATGQIISSVTNPDGGHTLTGLGSPLGLFIVFSCAELVLARLSGACRLYVAPLQRTAVTRALFDHLSRHSHRYLSNSFAGSLASRIAEASLGVNLALWAVLFDFLPIAVTLCVSVALLYQANLSLAAFACVWALGFVGLSYLLARRSQVHAHAHAAARSETTGKIVDAVTNLASVRLFGRLGFENRYLSRFLGQEVRAFRRSMGFNELVLWFQFSAALVLKVGMIVIALQLWRAGTIDAGQFVMAVSLALLVINDARNISRRFLDFFEYVGNVENGVRVIVRPHEVFDHPDARALEIREGRVEFKDVRFGYDAERPIFKGLSVTIEAGQRVGLVGASGSGKTTFTNLLLRLYDPQAGAILIDGIDIRSVTQESLHTQISLIPQDPGLFHRTLAENIRYGRIDADDEAIISAARLADAHDFIEGMDERYQSMVGERGVKLSGGQRQRIAMARAILKNAPILVMDEATSSLDSATESSIQENLENVMTDKTVIVVAHRLSTVAQLDRILVFDQGRIVEDGTPDELMRLQGIYCRLWQLQASQGATRPPAHGPTLPASVTTLPRRSARGSG